MRLPFSSHFFTIDTSFHSYSAFIILFFAIGSIRFNRLYKILQSEALHSEVLLFTKHY